MLCVASYNATSHMSLTSSSNHAMNHSNVHLFARDVMRELKQYITQLPTCLSS